MGVNFSIPIDTVKWVVEELLEFGEVRIPWVGWRLEEAVSQAERQAIGMAEEEGVVEPEQLQNDL